MKQEACPASAVIWVGFVSNLMVYGTVDRNASGRIDGGSVFFSKSVKHFAAGFF
jgi:hypothetical protein